MNEVEELVRLLDDQAIETDESDRREHSGDWWPRRLIEERAGSAAVTTGPVVRPRSTLDVSAVLEWADRTRTAVVPYGLGSGVCGGIAPVDGIVMDLSLMNEISDLDDKSHLVTAQAGVSGPQLRDFLSERGFTLGHEPQSMDISTVGGWLATRACGQLSARYGGIEDLVAGLEVVLPGGTILPSKPVARRSAGPDLKELLIGSEGTLGVITEVTLKIAPEPTSRANRCLLFEHMTDGVKACRSLAQSDLRPTVVRLYDREDTALFTRHETEPIDDNILLMSFDGREANARADEAVALAGGSTLDERFVVRWWQHRNDAVEEFRTVMRGEGLLGPHAVVDTMEVSGTWTQLRDLYHSLKTSLTEVADFVGCHLSHIYTDGACLYFTLGSACNDDSEALEVNDKWWDVGMRACLEAGGSISHHHGIGRLKARWLPSELGPWFDLLAGVKKAVDPNGIMNPGALGL